MIEIIPSKYVREYYEEKGIELSDMEKAAILWNRGDIKRWERLAALKELSELTEDEDLRKQIKERLEFEAEQESCFSSNEEGKCLFAIYDKDTEYPEGFFASYAKAKEYGDSEFHGGYSIEKYSFLDHKQEQKGKFKWNADGRMGEASYDNEGHMTYLWCMMPEDKQIIGENWENQNDRFEDKLIMWDVPFMRGDIVRDCRTNAVGIVESIYEENERFLENMENGLHYDFMDTSCLMVEFLNEKGNFSHEHPQFFELELDTSDDHDEVILLASEIIKGNAGLDFFLDVYEENKKKCELEYGDDYKK